MEQKRGGVCVWKRIRRGEKAVFFLFVFFDRICHGGVCVLRWVKGEERGVEHIHDVPVVAMAGEITGGIISDEYCDNDR